MHCIYGIDPGTTKAGWVYYDKTNKKVLGSGHDDWKVVRDMLQSSFGAAKITKRLLKFSVVVEKPIIYTGTPGGNTIMPEMIQACGRIQQICADYNVDYLELTRMDICEKITGSRPKRGKKVSKADMQKLVQTMLGLPKPIRPQHASDAMAAIIAEFPDVV